MRLAVFMTRVYDLQPFFGLRRVTRSEAVYDLPTLFGL
jgi:hypothetical protein